MSSTVTCRTDGCENNGVPLEVELEWTDEFSGETFTTDRVVCGPCGQEITDIADVVPSEGE